MTGYFSPEAPRKAAQDPLARTRTLLRFGAPMVSLTALIWAAPALAQTTVSSDLTTPLLTSKAGDITISAGNSIKPPSGAAVTIDSNNKVTNNGLIQFQNIDNVTGVLIQGGHTGQLTNNGTIEVDDTSSTSTDKNGIPHGPFAKGGGRIGIHLVGPGDFTGDILNEGAGTITVRGDNSAGISLET